MARDLYNVPVPYLVGQGEETARDLHNVALDPRNPYLTAGVDPTAHADELAAAAGALAEAWGHAERARAARTEASYQARQTAVQAYRWLGWLGRLVAGMAADGRPIDLPLATLHSPRTAGLQAALRVVLPDIERQREVLASALTDLAVLDRGPLLLAEVEASAVAFGDAEKERKAALQVQRAANARLVRALRRHDRDVLAVKKLTGVTPLGGARAVVAQFVRTPRGKRAPSVSAPVAAPGTDPG